MNHTTPTGMVLKSSSASFDFSLSVMSSMVKFDLRRRTPQLMSKPTPPACVHVCMYLCMYVCLEACMDGLIYVMVHVSACMYVCVYVFMCEKLMYNTWNHVLE